MASDSEARVVIAYGICIGNEDKYQSFARTGLAVHGAADAPIFESRDNDSIFTAYNEILDALAGERDLEALVLLHEDVELRDPDAEAKVRRVLSDPRVGVAGVIGGRQVRSLAWWDGQGVGRCAETRGIIDFGGRHGDVDCVDGLLLVLSPWAVRYLRFDADTFHGFHAYDLDICFQARARGRVVRTFDLDVFHHTKGGYGNSLAYMSADRAFRQKWAAELALSPLRAR